MRLRCQSCFQSLRTYSPRPLSRIRYSTQKSSNLRPLLRFIPPRDLLVDISIGTPPQKFTLLLDTGSSDLWVTGSTSLAASPSRKFRPSRSKSWTRSSSAWGAKYYDRTMAEGIQGIEKVKLGDWVFDARIGVAEKLTEEVKDVRIPLEKFTGIKAGKEGFEDVDGILGMDLESSFIVGLREAGARGFKLTFERNGEGRDNLEILKDFDKEKGVIWYKVDTASGEPTWELVLTNVSYKDQSLSVPRGTKMLVDTGGVHHYLPPGTAQDLFHEQSLTDLYQRIHFTTSYESASSDNEAGYLLHTPPCPTDPVHLQFAGSNVKWPISLQSPIEDQYASIRAAAKGGRSILGMPFLSSLKGVIFDFTKGNERIGFISWENMEEETKYGDRKKDHIIQFIVGTTLFGGLVLGWRWYEGSLF